MQKQEKKVYLDLNHAFGSNFTLDSRNQIGIIEEDGHMKMVYTVGKVIVKQSIQNKSMEFIRLSDSIESIQCMALSPTRNHIAVCQKIKNQNFLLLNLYGLKNRDSEIKHFKLPQTEKQSSFKIIAFSPSQPKYACCMTADPDNQLMFLDISRSRGLAVSNFTVEGTQSIAICPTQSHLISCAGKNIFKLFKVEDYSFKTYEQVKKLPKARNFTAHAWFDKTKILIGTDRGELFMIGPVGNNFQVKRHLGNVFTNESIGDNSVDLSLSSICVFSKGFIVGSSRGFFSLWMKRQQGQQNFQDQYTGDLIKKWQVGEQHIAKVASIAMCPQQQHIAIAFDNSAIATTTLQNLLQAQQVQGANKTIEGDILNYLYNGFHQAEINSMDVCLHRPILATLSRRENMIRLWNYKKPKCELIKIFDSKSDGIQQIGTELINCLSLHPLGYYMAVGCCDKLRIYHILESQLRNFREILVRGVCCLKFSNGGQFLAAAYPRQKNTAQKSSVHLINIYNSYTLQQIGRLNDHSNIITDLCWKSDDRALFSVGIDGTATEWKQGDPKSQTKEWIAKKWTQGNAKYSSVMYERTARSILASGTESGKSVIRQFKIEKEAVQKLFAIGGFRVSKLAWLTSQWNIPAILAGTQQGHLKVFNSVFDNIVQQSINAHRKEVTGICNSPCGRYVITCSKDGIIFIYQVSLTNRQGFVNRKLHDQINDYQINPLVGVMDQQLSQIVLVQRNDLTQKNRYNKILQKNLQQMKRKLMIQEQDDNKRYQTELNLLVKEKDQVIRNLSSDFDKLRAEKQELEISAQSNYIQLQNKNQRMLQDLEALYQKKLAIQNKKYFQLQNIFEKQKEGQQLQQSQFIKRMDETLSLLKHQFIQCYRKAQKVHNGQQQAITLGQKQFTQKMTQIQQQHQSQMRKVSQAIVNLQHEKNKMSIQYITNIQSLKRQCRILSQDIVRFMSQNEMMAKQHEQLQYQLSQLNKSMLIRKQELANQQEALKNRQQKISQYQERISDLTKKKDILAYRTWEIRQEIEPREDQIQFLKEEIYQIQLEFQKLLEDQKLINEAEIKIKKHKQSLQQQLQNQKNSTKDRQLKVKKICQQIESIVQSKNSDKRYYQIQMNTLYQKYFKFMSQTKRNNYNMKGAQEIQRHISHIDQQIEQVNKKTDVTLKKRDEEIQRATQENADLIKQLTASRQQRMKLSMQFKNVQKIVDNLMRQIKQIKNLSNNESKGNENFKMQKRPINDQFKPLPTIPTINLLRSSSQPIIKGKISKGVNYDPGSLSIFTKAKLKELEGKLQMVKLNLRQREVIGRIVKRKIQDHIEKNNCNDPSIKKMMEEIDF